MILLGVLSLMVIARFRLTLRYPGINGASVLYTISSILSIKSRLGPTKLPSRPSRGGE